MRLSLSLVYEFQKPDMLIDRELITFADIETTKAKKKVKISQKKKTLFFCIIRVYRKKKKPITVSKCTALLCYTCIYSSCIVIYTTTASTEGKRYIQREREEYIIRPGQSVTELGDASLLLIDSFPYVELGRAAKKKKKIHVMREKGISRTLEF